MQKDHSVFLPRSLRSQLLATGPVAPERVVPSMQELQEQDEASRRDEVQSQTLSNQDDQVLVEGVDKDEGVRVVEIDQVIDEVGVESIDVDQIASVHARLRAHAAHSAVLAQ